MADSHWEAVTESDRGTARLAARAQHPLSGVPRWTFAVWRRRSRRHLPLGSPRPPILVMRVCSDSLLRKLLSSPSNFSQSLHFFERWENSEYAPPKCFGAARHERHTQENKLPVDRRHNYDALKKKPRSGDYSACFPICTADFTSEDKFGTIMCPVMLRSRCFLALFSSHQIQFR